MPLSIQPVRLNKSIYLRVPNDLADLIEINHQTRVTMNFEEMQDRFLLIYSVQKQTVTVPLTVSQLGAEGNTTVENEPRPKSDRVNV